MPESRVTPPHHDFAASHAACAAASVACRSRQRFDAEAAISCSTRFTDGCSAQHHAVLTGLAPEEEPLAEATELRKRERKVDWTPVGPAAGLTVAKWLEPPDGMADGGVVAERPDANKRLGRFRKLLSPRVHV